MPADAARNPDAAAPSCRGCGAPLAHTFLDLGATPLANAYRGPADSDRPEYFHPLKAQVCGSCLLVQLAGSPPPAELFSDYAYLSSMSASWRDHLERYARDIRKRLDLDSDDLIVEIASNDGYLLKCFQDAGHLVLGVDPAANVARRASEERSVPTLVRFFGRDTASAMVADGQSAQLIVANNVLAHAPDINDFVAGLRILLAADGMATIEFPHVLNLIAECQFDTIYHEHVFYLSLLAVEPIFDRHGLRVFDVETLTTHGGSLRLYVCHRTAPHMTRPAVAAMRETERDAALDALTTYTGFAEAVARIKRDLLAFLIEAKRAGRSVVGYGAPAKGNMLLSHCGIGPDLLAFTVDHTPMKQGTFLPGTGIPVLAPAQIAAARPDYVLILPWNLKAEIAGNLSYVGNWGGKLAVPIPTLEVFDPPAGDSARKEDQPVQAVATAPTPTLPDRPCRHCGAALGPPLIDLGALPNANRYLAASDLDAPERRVPIRPRPCPTCRLVQLEAIEDSDSFFEAYPNFVSFADDWVRHAAAYCRDVVTRLGLDESSEAIEIACNDGYLLQFMVARGIPVLGIEPAAAIAAAAAEKDIPVRRMFFGAEVAQSLVDEGHRADLLIANNVIGHVPELNDFIAGMKTVLADDGVATLEFHHLRRMVADNQFDLFYEDHLSYFGVASAERIFAEFGLRLFDVEEVPVHGGLLRLWLCHNDADRRTTQAVDDFKRLETDLYRPETFASLGGRIATIKHDLLTFLLDARAEGRTVAAYGAPAKGNTLLNHCGIGRDLIAYTVDRSPHKQGLFLPGSRLPIHAPEHVMHARPDYLLVLPWNFRDEIRDQMAGIRDWGGKFVVAVPRLEVLP